MNTRTLDSEPALLRHFMPHQAAWIQAENPIHAQGKHAVALAEKSVRIGWTFADAFKNVRKRLWFKDRDYLFATKDYASALEYVRQCYKFAEIYNLTRAITSHGEEFLSVNRPDAEARPSSFTDEVRVGVIRFDNGSRILAFSASPQAMAVYGGDVGLDEFAKHPHARLLWETAQGRVAWGFDLAIWSSHDGEDTLFNEFAQEARAAKGPWNIYARVTLLEAIQMGLVDTINRVRGTSLSPDQFVQDCRARARDPEIFEQAYMCNPVGSAANHIVEWSAIERCRFDYSIERVHLEADQVIQLFADFSPQATSQRDQAIKKYIHQNFSTLFDPTKTGRSRFRLGFDVAASGQGDLAAIYIDEARGDELWLRGLFTCRTEDWHFLKSVLFAFLRGLSSLSAAGDESGLGRQVCWEAARQFSGRFSSVTFGTKKHDLGFSLMNQLATAAKRFPRDEQDVAADLFALRKRHNGSKWTFTEGRNTLNAASHCDIAWAAALASHAHVVRRWQAGARVV